jgi:hypothetical protein
VQEVRRKHDEEQGKLLRQGKLGGMKVIVKWLFSPPAAPLPQPPQLTYTAIFGTQIVNKRGNYGTF